MRGMAPDTLLRDLPGHLDRWVARGLLAPEQAQRILHSERAAPGPRPPASLVTEALGYVGGVLVLVGTVVLTGDIWSDLPLGGQLALAAGATVLLLVAGAALPSRRGAPARLRAVCWLLAVGALAGTAALLGDDALGLPGDGTGLLATGSASVVAGVLWWFHRTVVQLAALVAATVGAAATATSLLPGSDDPLVGLAVWGVGAVWTVLGLGAAVPGPRAAVLLGGAAVVLGGFLLTDAGWGTVLAVVSAVALVAGGVALRELPLLVVGSVAVLVTVPTVVSQYFPDTLTAPFVLLAVGVVLVVGALWTARRGRGGPVAGRYALPARTAVLAARVGGLLVAATVLVLGVPPA